MKTLVNRQLFTLSAYKMLACVCFASVIVWSCGESADQTLAPNEPDAPAAPPPVEEIQEQEEPEEVLEDVEEVPEDSSGTVVSQKGVLQGGVVQQGGVGQGKGGVLQGKGGVLQGKGGVLQGKGGVLQGKGGVGQGKGGVLQGKGGVGQGKGGVLQGGVMQGAVVVGKGEPTKGGVLQGGVLQGKGGVLQGGVLQGKGGVGQGKGGVLQGGVAQGKGGVLQGKGGVGQGKGGVLQGKGGVGQGKGGVLQGKGGVGQGKGGVLQGGVAQGKGKAGVLQGKGAMQQQTGGTGAQGETVRMWAQETRGDLACENAVNQVIYHDGGEYVIDRYVTTLYSNQVDDQGSILDYAGFATVLFGSLYRVTASTLATFVVKSGRLITQALGLEVNQGNVYMKGSDVVLGSVSSGNYTSDLTAEGSQPVERNTKFDFSHYGTCLALYKNVNDLSYLGDQALVLVVQ